MVEESGPPKKRRKGGKIFLGCGTCRIRKIKCDLREPTCHNCERSRRYTCDAYQNDSGISPGMSTRPPSAAALIASQLHDNTSTDAPEKTSSTVYSTFSANDTTTADANLSMGVVPLTDFLGDYLNSPSSWPQFDFDGDFNNFSFTVPTSPNLQALQSISAREHLIEQRFAPKPSESTMQSIVSLTRGTNADLHSLPDDLAPEKALNATSLGAGTGSALSDAARGLIHHYKVHISEVMMPTSAPKCNPYLQIYMPLALQEPRTSPKLALLHAMLAVAATHKAHVALTQRELFLNQANESRKQAELMISEAMAGRRHSTQQTPEVDESNHALLAAAITLTTVEVSTLVMNSHLPGNLS